MQCWRPLDSLKIYFMRNEIKMTDFQALNACVEAIKEEDDSIERMRILFDFAEDIVKARETLTTEDTYFLLNKLKKINRNE